MDLEALGHRHYSWAFRSRGIHVATVQASGTRVDDGSETVSEPVAFTFLVDPAPVHWWLLDHFGSAAIQSRALLEADPHGSGITNLKAYAFGLDPNAPATGGLPAVEIRPVDGETYLWIVFRRPEGRDDVHYTVEVSTDLRNWSPVDKNTVPTESRVDTDGTPVMAVSDVAPVGEDTSRYLRVRTEWRP